MMKIEILEVAGLEPSMLAMRLPKGSKSKTGSGSGRPQAYYNYDARCFDGEAGASSASLSKLFHSQTN